MKLTQLYTACRLRFYKITSRCATRNNRQNKDESCNPWLCGKCGSDNISQRVWADPNSGEVIEWDNICIDDSWCDECEEHTRQVQQCELLMSADSWWNEADFRQMERTTGYRQADFDPESGCQSFVDACEKWWNAKRSAEKIIIYLDKK